jgi:hypothetical protein
MKKLLLSLVLLVLALPALALIGNTNTSTSVDAIATSINAARFVASSNMTVDRIMARVVGISGGYRCAIYNGTATSPTTFIVGSAQVNTTTNGWYSFALNAETPLKSGSNYWLAIWSSLNGSVYYTTGGTLRWTTNSYTFGNWPATLPTATGAAFNYSIYATDVVTNIPPTRPMITSQPVNTTNLFGNTVVFSVGATGTSPVIYQWYFSGYTNFYTGQTNQFGVKIFYKTNLPYAPVANGNASNLSCIVTVTNLGLYIATVSNSIGSTNSTAARLEATNAPPSPNLVFNFSWTNKPTIVKYELWSTTNLTFPFVVLTNLANLTNYSLVIPKTNLQTQQFFKLIAYESPNVSTNLSVKLAWDASPDATVTGYRLYMGMQSGIYTNSFTVGNTLTSTIANLMPSLTYYFGAVAYNASGMESPFSNEVIYTTPNGTPTGPITLLDWPFAYSVSQ